MTMTSPVYTRTPVIAAGASDLVSPRVLNDLRLMSTLTLLLSFILAGVALIYANDADQAFKYPAPFVGVGIGFALWIEGQAGLRNLVRVDVFMLMVLFLLTFFEFILPQDSITDRVSLPAAQTAVQATLLGFTGIVVGRHIFPANRPLPRRIDFQVSPKGTTILLIACGLLGYLYMLLAVSFDISEMIYQMTRPRFSQPWTRGRFGSLSTLLNEFGLLKYLIPPLAAAILAQWRKYKLWQVAIALALLSLVFFEGFAGGTRNIFLIHLITFSASFALMLPRLTFSKLAMIFAPILVVAYFAIYYLPEIRTVGLENFNIEESRTDTLFVDMNLINIAHLTEVFPETHPHLGFEVPYVAAVRPIPRALWPSKPEGLSLSIEEAVGARGLTLSATFVGELWMAGGYMAVLMAALSFGALSAYWNRRAVGARSNLDMIIFAVALFPAGLGMRSFMSLAPTLLPLLAIILYTKVVR
ncbi:hypothetical protein [uncultured Pelagimonas sp.]|uniref:hypothetical protein n=1 Tax=uncultured Pelagimonas sp. TaxID=1618102 RepID=UPI002622946C|nr:hypothetical protein [uncultured Pelagimonas sp.]